MSAGGAFFDGYSADALAYDARPPVRVTRRIRRDAHMSRALLLNLVHDEERRAALLEHGRLSLLWIERREDHTFVGNVYKGRVLRLEPSIGAAFVDLGLERPGFLHASDIRRPWSEEAGAGAVRDGELAIEDYVEAGADVVVQVTRDPIAHKGATISTYVSLPGRTLVLIPRLGRTAVSRKIEDEPERERLRSVLDGFDRPDDVGVVARTAAVGMAADELTVEYGELRRTHDRLMAKVEQATAPALLHADDEFAARAVRELCARSPDGSNGPLQVIVDDPAAEDLLRDALSAEADARIEVHDGDAPLFHAHGVEQEVRRLRSPRVALEGGASLVIQQTEALWAIDVNSGRRRNGGNLEQTALDTDLVAAVEVARQIRLRDLAGLIIVDFIDCKDPENRARVEEAVRRELARDPARMRVAAMSEFMVQEITRRRARAGAGRAGLAPCTACGGTGHVHKPSAAGLAALRDVGALLARREGTSLEIACAPAVADDLEGREDELLRLERRHRATIDVVEDPDLAPDRFVVRAVRAG